MTILIWGIANQKFEVKRCHEFIMDYYGDWFPKLPKYKAFNKRIHLLADAFKALAGVLLGRLGALKRPISKRLRRFALPLD